MLTYTILRLVSVVQLVAIASHLQLAPAYGQTSAHRLTVSWYEPDRAFDILERLHARALEKPSPITHLSPRQAHVRYTTDLVSVLVAFREIQPDQQRTVFDRLLVRVKNKKSLMALESLFASGLHAMALLGDRERVTEGLAVWTGLWGGQPALAPHVYIVADPRTHSMFLMTRLPNGPELLSSINAVSLRVTDWLKHPTKGAVPLTASTPLPRLDKHMDGSGHGDAVDDFLHQWQQRGVEALEAIVPTSPPTTTGDYVVVVLSPIWIGTLGPIVATGGVAVPALMEAAWHDMKIIGVGTIGIIVTAVGEAPSLFSGPERQQDRGGVGTRQNPVVQDQNGSNSRPDSQGSDRGSDDNNHRTSGASSTPPSGFGQNRGEGIAGGRVERNTNRREPQPEDQTPAEPTPPGDGGDPETKKEPDKGGNEAKAYELGDESRVRSYTKEAWESGGDPYFEELPLDTEPMSGQSGTGGGSDIGGHNMPRSSSKGELLYRIVYGETWFIRHPDWLRLFASKIGADGEEQIDFGQGSSRTQPSSGTDGENRENDLRGAIRKGSGASSTLDITVKLPVPEDFRPMPLK